MSKIRIVRYLLYAIVLACAAVLRFSAPQIILFDKDATGYCAPAVSWLANGQFLHLDARSYPYPALVLLILWIFKSVNAVRVVQHLLALVFVTGLLFFIEKRSTKYLDNGRREMLFTLLNILLAAALLLNINLVVLEARMRPEGVVMPFTILLAATMVYYYNYRGRVRLIIFGILELILLTGALMHPRMGAGLFAIALVALIFELNHRRSAALADFIKPTVLFLLLAAAVIMPERLLVAHYDGYADTFAYRQFFYSNARTVLKALNQGYAQDKGFDTDTLKQQLQQVIVTERNEDWFPVLGYDLDKLQYGEAGTSVTLHLQAEARSNYLQAHPAHEHARGAKMLAAFYHDYKAYYKGWSLAILTKYPADILNKVLHQLQILFFSPRISWVQYYYLPTEQQYFDLSRGQNLDLIAQLGFNPMANVNFTYPPAANKWSNVYLNWAFKRLLPLFLVFYLVQILRRKISLLQFCLFILFSFTVITIAVLHTFDNARYIASLFPVTALLVYFPLLDYIREPF